MSEPNTSMIVIYDMFRKHALCMKYEKKELANYFKEGGAVGALEYRSAESNVCHKLQAEIEGAQQRLSCFNHCVSSLITFKNVCIFMTPPCVKRTQILSSLQSLIISLK